MYDICIMGGGASGMLAGIYIKLKRPKLKVCIVEKNDVLAKKLSITGNGKCNISNCEVDSSSDTIDFLRSIGIYTRKEVNSNRIYPISESAKDVVSVLENNIRCLGIDVKLSQSVTDIKISDRIEYKVVKTEKEVINAKNIIFAFGGKSYPKLGTTGDGYVLARKNGYKVTNLAPGLAGIKCRSVILRPFKGRTKADIYLYCKGNLIAKQFGEIQFTEYGLSGIAVFNLSNLIKLDKVNDVKFEDYELKMDFVPEMSYAELVEILEKRLKHLQGNDEIKQVLCTLVDKHVATDITRCAVDNEFAKGNAVYSIDIKNIVKYMKQMSYKVDNICGWKEAQVTVGGVCHEEYDEKTMESYKDEGVYFIGEMTEYAGMCGGYNLENAWHTALKAGKSICTKYNK